jgi:hypothetical protein
MNHFPHHRTTIVSTNTASTNGGSNGRNSNCLRH